jgi:HAMP domain-containing protein
MSKGTNAGPDDERRTTQEIPLWTRRYAANRTLPVAVNLVAYLVGCAAMAGLSYLTVYLWLRVNPATALAGAVPLLGFCAFWVWFSLGGAKRVLAPVTQRLYRGEGEATVEAPAAIPKVAWLGAAILLTGALAEVVLGAMEVVPMEYMQPISTIYIVPALALICSSPGVRATPSPFMVIWPGLYVLHAGLVIAGAPIQFGRQLAMLNMLIPVVGYGLVAALAGHVYSRYALRKLREAAAADGQEGQTDE